MCQIAEQILRVSPALLNKDADKHGTLERDDSCRRLALGLAAIDR